MVTIEQVREEKEKLQCLLNMNRKEVGHVFVSGFPMGHLYHQSKALEKKIDCLEELQSLMEAFPNFENLPSRGFTILSTNYIKKLIELRIARLEESAGFTEAQEDISQGSHAAA